MKRTMILSIVVRGSIVSMLLLSLTVKAQDKTVETKNEDSFLTSQYNAEKAFKPFIALETWGTYNLDNGNATTETANRFDVSLRRFRFGASGTPYSWLSYTFQLHADRLGEDNNAFTKGSYGGIDIWNAYMTAKLLKESELLNVHAGYYWAAISRQYNTSPWAVGTFDKTRAGFYLRSFMTGKGNGIESGVGFGGLKNFEKFGISYRIGTYEPAAYVTKENSGRLYTGRLMVSIGDPEQKKYSYMLSGNQWAKRTGVTLGFGASSQNDGKLTDTTTWDNSMAYGADILINYKGLRVDGEYYLMKRTAENVDDFDGREFHVQIGYSIPVKKTFIEPSFTYEKYEGEGNKGLFKQIGDDVTYDIGLNCYLDGQKIKLSLHYVMQEGSISKAIGDYIGTAFQIRL
jgi:hypothetical protein